MGHLPRCFNAPYFLLTRGQFSTPAVHDSESCVSRAVPNWAKVIFFLVCRVMLAHYPWNLVIYHLYYLLHIIGIITMYKLYYIIITPLPTYLPPYLLHMKAGPRLPTSGDSNWSKAVKAFPKWSTAEVLICGPCWLLSRNSVQTNRGLSLEQVWLEMWCIWSRYEQ